MDLKKKMKNFFTLTRKADGGFTLVELIVVIAILAILGGVAVPAYSGYVKKAERANDEALLKEINTAFTSACVMNGASNFGRNDVVAELASGTFNYSAPYADSFKGFYEGNGTFKVYEAIIYNAKTGMFAEATATASKIYNILKTTYGNEIALLMASNLGAMGAETLLTEVGDATDWAAENGLAELGGENYMNAVKSYLGLAETATEDEVAAAMLALANNDTDLATKIAANTVALYAAQNTSSVTTDSVMGWLTGESNVDTMMDSASSGTLANAAAIYGLYMAYQGDDFETGNGVLTVMNSALNDSNFASWINTDEGKAELEAYKASMAIVEGASNDADAMNSILTNGFDDPELIKVLESLMGN